MRESHEKALVFAVCEDKTVHLFGSFYENTVGDDIYGSYRIETEVGHYSFTPEEEINGLISIMPDPIILQSYLAGEPHEEYDSICNVLEINSKIKAFYWIYTDEEGGSDNLIITKITGDAIQEFNDENLTFITVPKILLRMMLLENNPIKFDGDETKFNALISN